VLTRMKKIKIRMKDTARRMSVKIFQADVLNGLKKNMYNPKSVSMESISAKETFGELYARTKRNE
jgi:hypothetical protein